MAEFFEERLDRVCTLTAEEDAGHFSFGCGCDDILYGSTHNMDGALLLIVVVGLFVSTNQPEARDFASGCTRYAASVSIARIMSLAWYRSVASG